VDRRDPSLPADLTPQRWRAFLDDYFRFVDFAYFDVASTAERERRRKAILRKHGIALPSDVEEDDHPVSSRLCIEGHFAHHYQFDGFPEFLPFHDFLRHIQTRRAHRRLTEPLLFKPYAIPAVSGDPTLNLFSSQLRAVAAHVAPYADEAIARFFWQYETSRGASWQWDIWYSTFPADACALPGIWQPDYGRRFTEYDLTVPERQVIATAIPSE
jgi:hypothetical protein